MPKLKKTGSAGRLGPRYGKTVRSRLVRVESKQKQKQPCPFCGKQSVKRVSSSIWKCTDKKCDKKFASREYYLEERF
ncbi:MAG: 50S ribosomal protein L37ae [Candidatus Pacearchaeota archaeon]